jgi:hypothetical protein
MKLNKLIGILSISTLIVGCKKETFNGDDLIGNWKCDKYTYVYWGQANDSTLSSTKEITQPCFLNIESGTNTEFYYGNGTSNLPLSLNVDQNGGYENSEPTMTEGPCNIEASGSAATFANNNDYFQSEVNFGQELQLIATCEFKLITANKLNMKVLLRLTTGDTHRYTYALLELTK